MRDRGLVEKLYAEFYDLFVADFQQDLPVYLDVAGKSDGPILEVGCATGRVLERIAEAGHAAHGIDTARDMLELARVRVRPYRDRVRVTDHDLRAAPVHHGFGAAIAPRYSINWLIDVEEQRLFLRHLRQSLRAPAAVVLDCFCPLALVRPETNGEWREIERSVEGRPIAVRDRRELLTPLLERRTQLFSVGSAKPAELVTHRRYVPPTQLAALLEEAGFEGILWAEDYDLRTARAIESDSRPRGPFLVMAETG